jgi:hypothetical protein
MRFSMLYVYATLCVNKERRKRCMIDRSEGCILRGVTNMSETKIQHEILTYLKKRGIFCFRCNNGGVYDAKIHRYRTSVSLPGVPDIIGIHGGRFLGIEVKTSKGKQSPEQVMFQKRVEEDGGIYILATSPDDVQKKLWG